jgi:cell division transport system permease protein
MKPLLSKGRKSSQELPLQRDDNARFMPWIMAVMVFLLALSLAFAMATHAAIKEWNAALTTTVTIQVPAPSLADAKSDILESRVQKVVDYLKSVNGIASVDPVDPAESVELLSTWLGEGNIKKELPVPRLIDVTMADDAELDLTELEEKIAALVPGATLDDHKMWMDEVLAFGKRVVNASFTVAGLVAFATFIMVVFATRSGLVTHHRTIELLHIMGARNGYIAGQFARNAFWVGFLGGLAGLICAAGLIYGLSQAFADIAQGLLPDWHLRLRAIAFIALLPLIAGTVAMLTAGSTVLSKLSRIL